MSNTTLTDQMIKLVESIGKDIKELKESMLGKPVDPNTTQTPITTENTPK